jgi:hypothetical protein
MALRYALCAMKNVCAAFLIENPNAPSTDRLSHSAVAVGGRVVCDAQVRWFKPRVGYVRGRRRLTAEPFLAEVVLKKLPLGLHHLKVLWKRPGEVVYRAASQFIHGKTAWAIFELSLDESSGAWEPLASDWHMEILVDDIVVARRDFVVTFE